MQLKKFKNSNSQFLNLFDFYNLKNLNQSKCCFEFECYLTSDRLNFYNFKKRTEFLTMVMPLSF